MLQHVDPFNDIFSLPAYLFKAPGDCRVAEFQEIEYQLLQLNNFFHGFQSIAAGRVASLKEEMARKRPSTEYVTYPDGSRTLWHDHPDIIPIYHHLLPFWEELADFIAPATQLLLLYILTEKSLKRLCILYSQDHKAGADGSDQGKTSNDKAPDRVKRRQNESMMTAYLRVLQEECALSFSCPSSVQMLDGKVREVRNSFGHGDWDQVVESVKDVDVIKAFESFRDLFNELANARLRSRPAQSDDIPF